MIGGSPMFQPYGTFHPHMILPPQHLQGLLGRMAPILARLGNRDLTTYAPSFVHAGAVLGGYLAGRGLPPEHAAAWVDQWLQSPPPATEGPNPPAASEPAQTESEALVMSAEADDFRALLSTSINAEATASSFYANIADALEEHRLTQEAEWVRQASRDEQHHLTILQQRYRELFGNPYKPLIGKTAVDDLQVALVEALNDEFKDARKYRDAYLAHPNPADQRIFFELATDELRHSVIMTNSRLALR